MVDRVKMVSKVKESPVEQLSPKKIFKQHY